MNPSTPPPLPDDLASLFAAERNAPDPSPAVRDQVLARVAVTTGGAGIGGALSPVRWGAVKGLAGVMVALAVGGGVWSATRPAATAAVLRPVVSHGVAAVRSHPVSVAAVVASAAPSVVEAASAVSPVAANVAPVAPAVSPRTVAATAPSDEGSESEEDSAAEHVILDAARRAIVARDGAAAMRAVEEHVQRFPHGSLVEEREALAIEGLTLTGDAAAANARARRFHRRYPDSVFGAVVDEALATL